MQITMVCGNYDFSKSSTELTVYDGDVNENILRKFLMAKIARGCSHRTVNYYKNSIRCTFDKINKPYNEVTADDIRMYLAIRVQRDGVSKTTANNERRNLSAFYTWLQKEEILLKNPMSKVEMIKETKKKKKAFSQMELEKLRYSCRSSRETALIELLISTWCRVSEVANIKLSDIDGNKILIHGKGDKEREVYMSPKAQLAVSVYMGDRKDTNPYLFPKCASAGNIMAYNNEQKKQAEMCKWYMNPDMVGDSACDLGTIETIVRNIGKRAGVVNVHPHRFRRTGATMALRGGMPLLTVSKLLGHENIGTTQIYLDISDKELEEAHEKYVV